MKAMCVWACVALLALAALDVRAGDEVPAAKLPPRVAAARDAEALRVAMLRLRFGQQQQFLRDLSDAQARHHETMMVIIRNMRPSGRYEYNPSTGRYDRYVPNP